MAKIIAIANQKGGTGKTTTSTCLAGALQLLGKKVLLVDCDAQCNATDTYGAQTEDVCTLFDVMTRQGTVEEGIQHCEAGDILPSDNALKDIDEQLVRDMGKNFRLREALESVSGQYDYIVMDTPPQLGLALERTDRRQQHHRAHHSRPIRISWSEPAFADYRRCSQILQSDFED